MSNNVNVLVVMDEYPEVLDFAASHYGEWVANSKSGFRPSTHVVDYLKKAREARSAVAELIEAMDKLFGADMEHCMEMDGKEDQLEAVKFAKSALAHVKGGAA
jgi:hypothetical protein